MGVSPSGRSVRRFAVILSTLFVIVVVVVAGAWLVSPAGIAPPTEAALAAERLVSPEALSTPATPSPVAARPDGEPTAAGAAAASASADEAGPAASPSALETWLTENPRLGDVRAHLNERYPATASRPDIAVLAGGAPAPDSLGMPAPTLELQPTWAFDDLPWDRWAVEMVAMAPRTFYIASDVATETVGTNIGLARYVDGQQVWFKTYDGPAHGDDYTGAVAARGSTIYTAGDRQTAYGDSDFVLSRWDSSGKRIWTRSYDSGDHGWEIVTDVAIDGDGNVTATGASLSWRGGWDWFVISYKKDGTRRWVRRWDSPVHLEDVPLGLVHDSAGRVYVCGYTDSDDAPFTEALTIKYSASGDRLWTRRTGALSVNYQPDIAYSLRLRPGGGVYIAGVTSANGSKAGLLAAFAGDGTRVFTVYDDGHGGEFLGGDAWFNDLEVAPGGNVICGGSQYVVIPDPDDVMRPLAQGWQRLLVEVAPDGTVVSREIELAPGANAAYGCEVMAMAKDSQGAIVATGTWLAESGYRGAWQFLTQRLCEGGTSWSSLWPSDTSEAGFDTDDGIQALAVSGVNVYVVGVRYIPPSGDVPGYYAQPLMAYVY
jgi:hypothetical protein